MKNSETENFPLKSDELIDIAYMSASTDDMTGLIPCGLKDREQIYSYNELYPYLAGNSCDYNMKHE